jgi:sugar transferase (PEP-CTERM/EpsH1 system associated)
MIKVMHLVLNLNVGGLERFIIELIKSYSNHISPIIVCLEGAGELSVFVEGAEIIALNEEPGMKFTAIRKLVDITKKYSIQVIHTHNEAAHFYGSVAGFMGGVPVVHTRHGRYLHNSRKKMFLNTVSSFLSSKIVGVSGDVSELMIRNEFIPRKKVLTILNGVDVDAYSPQPAKDIFSFSTAPASAIKIGIVARLNEVKDHLNLLNACKVLTGFTDDFQLIIVGDGPLRTQLEAEAQNLQINGSILFTGTRNDIADILNELDIYVLSSISEGTSMTLLEAMACELPVVATNVGGNPEVVMDGETGFLVPPKNPEAFAERLLLLIKERELRSTMGRAGRSRVLRHFSIAQTADKYERIYNKLTQGSA